MSQAAKTRPKAEAATPVRAAIYLRQSVAEQTLTGFTSLDAQRDACAHYIQSQAGQGWEVLPQDYGDAGFSGGNIERPGLKRLLEDIDRGLVDKVVVYKVDRLSRSLVDFARLMERFDRRKVGFASVSQSFDTSTSMGRLILNLLLSFGQFERELIGERTRDKVAAARKRGKWTGGTVIYGYRLDLEKHGLVIVPEEAEVVRLAFDLYAQSRSTLAVSERLNVLGHIRQRQGKESGQAIGGRPWDKVSVHRLLRNPLYAGLMRQGDDLHEAEHEGIIPREVFERVQRMLNDRSAGRPPRRSRKSEYLLAGILRCGSCGGAMTSSLSRGGNGRMYRYYRCSRSAKTGERCPGGHLSAAAIEAAVVREVRQVAARGEVQRRVLEELEGGHAGRGELDAQRERLSARLGKLKGDARRLIDAMAEGEPGSTLFRARLSEIEVQMNGVQRGLDEVEGNLRALEGARQRAGWVVDVLSAFDGVWDALQPPERREFLCLAVRGVQVDIGTRTVRVAFHELST
jgi:DNA invertase Pin-like site-specific DNA recombinase/ribosomal protein L34E